MVPADKIIPDGDIIVGKLIAQGGFGAVYEAQHQGAARVLKVRCVPLDPAAQVLVKAEPLMRVVCVYGSFLRH